MQLCSWERSLSQGSFPVRSFHAPSARWWLWSGIGSRPCLRCRPAQTLALKIWIDYADILGGVHAHFDEVSCVDDEVWEELGVSSDQLARHARLRRTHDAVATQLVRLDGQVLLDVLACLSKYKQSWILSKLLNYLVARCHFYEPACQSVATDNGGWMDFCFDEFIGIL